MKLNCLLGHNLKKMRDLKIEIEELSDGSRVKTLTCRDCGKVVLIIKREPVYLKSIE